MLSSFWRLHGLNLKITFKKTKILARKNNFQKTTLVKSGALNSLCSIASFKQDNIPGRDSIQEREKKKSL